MKVSTTLGTTLGTILMALSLQAQSLPDPVIEGVWQGSGNGGTVTNCAVANCDQEQEESHLPAMQFSVNVTRIEGANKYHVQFRPGLSFNVVLKNVRISDTKEKFELRHYQDRTDPHGYDYIFEHRRFLKTGEERVSIIVTNCSANRNTQCTVYNALALTRPRNSKQPVKTSAVQSNAQPNSQPATSTRTSAPQPPRAGSAPPKEDVRKPATGAGTPTDTSKSGRGRAAQNVLRVHIELDRAAVKVNEVALTKAIISGGVPPYQYRWWYDENHVKSATAPNIEWTMRTVGKHLFVLQTTDAAGNAVEARAEIIVEPGKK
jgi:hypothetical protein